MTELFSTTLQVCGDILLVLMSGYCLLKISELKLQIKNQTDEILKMEIDVAYNKDKLNKLSKNNNNNIK